jgi:diguanylate cyclase (GGDEF)-like protein/PAS domain S-box-containing protein
MTIAATVLMAFAQTQSLQSYSLDSPIVVHAGDQIVVYLVSAALITFFVKIYHSRLHQLQQLSVDLMQKRESIEMRKQELKRAQAVSHIGSWVSYLEADRIRMSSEACRILGMVPGQTIGYHDYMNLVHPEDKAELKQAWQLALNKQGFDHEYRVIVNGTVRWVRQKAELTFDASGHAVRAEGIVQDTSTLKQAQKALKASEDRYRTLIEWAPDAILVHKLGKIVYVNPAALRLFGAPYAQALMEKSTTELIHPNFREMQTDRMLKIYSYEPVGSAVECKFLRLDGEVIDVEVHGTAIDFDGELAIQVVVRNIAQRKRIESQVRQLAFYDELTQLPNRRLLQDRLSQAIAAHKRSRNYGAVMFLDLDNFKPLNDRFGHSVGDLLLVEVAQRLKTCVREMDTTARFGGDEFVVVIEELTDNLDESKLLTHNLANKIGACLSETYQLVTQAPDGVSATVQHHCTASIGVAMIDNPDVTPDDLVKWADAAMYQAKSQGRNCIAFYSLNNSSQNHPGESASST